MLNQREKEQTFSDIRFLMKDIEREDNGTISQQSSTMSLSGENSISSTSQVELGDNESSPKRSKILDFGAVTDRARMRHPETQDEVQKNLLLAI